MKLTHLALIMTLALVGITCFMVLNQLSDNTRDPLAQMRNGGSSASKKNNDADLRTKETEILMAQMAASQNAAPKPPPSMTSTDNQAASKLASSGRVSAASLEASPPTMTPRQRLLISLPAIGKVAESQQQYGFVVITAGSDKKLERGSVFALRRGKAVVGRIKVTEIENASAVANLQPGSVPLGVDVQMGDDVVQDLPPES